MEDRLNICQRFKIGKIRGRYVVLEVFLYMSMKESKRWLHHLSKSSRMYLVEMLEMINIRGAKTIEEIEDELLYALKNN